MSSVPIAATKSQQTFPAFVLNLSIPLPAFSRADQILFQPDFTEQIERNLQFKPTTSQYDYKNRLEEYKVLVRDSFGSQPNFSPPRQA